MTDMSIDRINPDDGTYRVNTMLSTQNKIQQAAIHSHSNCSHCILEFTTIIDSPLLVRTTSLCFHHECFHHDPTLYDIISPCVACMLYSDECFLMLGLFSIFNITWLTCGFCKKTITEIEAGAAVFMMLMALFSAHWVLFLLYAGMVGYMAYRWAHRSSSIFYFCQSV